MAQPEKNDSWIHLGHEYILKEVRYERYWRSEKGWICTYIYDFGICSVVEHVMTESQYPGKWRRGKEGSIDRLAKPLI